MDAQKYLNRYTRNDQIACALQRSLQQRTILTEPTGQLLSDNCVRYRFADGSKIVFNGYKYWSEEP